MKPRPTIERIWKLIEFTEKCWLWHGSKTKPNGYGRIRHKGKLVMAHKFLYEELIGPIPKGLVPVHLCRNNGCVNPWCIEPVTHG